MYKRSVTRHLRSPSTIRHYFLPAATFLHIAPVCFAAAAVLSLFFHNIGELTFNRLFTPLTAAVVFAFVAATVAGLMFRDTRKGDVFAAVGLVLFFTYGEAVRRLGLLTLPGPPHITAQYGVLAAWVSVLGVLYIRLQNSKQIFRKLSQMLIVAGVVMVVMPSWGIFRYQNIRSHQPRASSPMSLPKLKSSVPYLPDVYYIVPDSYPSSGNLSQYFSYDDSEFLSFLTSRGFYVAHDSTSNYPTTLLSLASTLNMEYLDYLSVHNASTDVSFGTDLIQNSNVLKLFRSQGYKFYQLGSWWWSTQRNPSADENFTIQKDSRLGLGEFAYDLLDSTMLSPFLEHALPAQVAGESEDDKRAIVEYQFRTLPEVAKLSGPKFVFVHMISPHQPYVFTADCQDTSYAQNWKQPEEQRYAEQVNCINQKLETVLDAILHTSPYPPVIILQSDEGIKFVADRLNPAESWQNASAAQLQEKFPILAAYYLPGVPHDSLYSGMTPVNSFRTVFNLYFSAQLPLLPDQNYIYLDKMHLYDFRDVTSVLPAKPAGG